MTLLILEGLDKNLGEDSDESVDFGDTSDDIIDPLYYASCFRLDRILNELLITHEVESGQN